MYPGARPEERVEHLLVQILFRHKNSELQSSYAPGTAGESLVAAPAQSCMQTPYTNDRDSNLKYGEQVLDLNNHQQSVNSKRRNYTKEEKANVRLIRDLGACDSCKKKTHDRTPMTDRFRSPRKQAQSIGGKGAIPKSRASSGNTGRDPRERLAVRPYRNAVTYSGPSGGGLKEKPTQAHSDVLQGQDQVVSHVNAGGRCFASPFLTEKVTTKDPNFGVGATIATFLHDFTISKRQGTTVHLDQPTLAMNATDVERPRGPPWKPPDGYQNFDISLVPFQSHSLDSSSFPCETRWPVDSTESPDDFNPCLSERLSTSAALSSFLDTNFNHLRPSTPVTEAQYAVLDIAQPGPSHGLDYFITQMDLERWP
ncbi:hypothetical protein EJ08DRAFT_656034 [Tothia fuscella]|uniref:Uncharacterized protein n=1 Tax=Tothia fuscella TaxID=1048955 RepID=A0A9P4P2W6_9PEZI|nr:hypothetical protein EJ08DRAFT_656034 [Tothia fuscella]